MRLLFAASLPLLASCDFTPPTVRINLGTPPNLRWPAAWDQLTAENIQEICTSVSEVYDTYLPGIIGQLVEVIMPRIEHTIPQEYIEEISGLADVVARDCSDKRLSKNIIELLNIVYEIEAFDVNAYAGKQDNYKKDDFDVFEFVDIMKNEHENLEKVAQNIENFFITFFYDFEAEDPQVNNQKACTSIMARNNYLGKNFAARNMDFNPAGPLRNMIADVIFYETETDTVPLYKGTTFVGYVGLWTSMKTNAFSITMNQRTYSRLADNLLNILLAQKMFERTGKDSRIWPISMKARKTTETCDTYKCAYNQMSQATNPAPSYVVMTGMDQDEGALLTKYSRSADIQKVQYQSYYPDNDWYLAQTNDDYWLEAGDARRESAHNSMDELGSTNVSIDNLLDVLDVPPVHAKHTIYSTGMDITTGEYKTVVRT